MPCVSSQGTVGMLLLRLTLLKTSDEFISFMKLQTNSFRLHRHIATCGARSAAWCR
jgi:hypothetical protein